MDELFLDIEFALGTKGELAVVCPDFCKATSLWGKRRELMSYLRHFPQVRTVKIQVEGKTEYPVLKLKPREIKMKELLSIISPVAVSLKASIFLIHYDGTYIEYLEGGHPGKTIIPYDEMIGEKAMQLLPEPMRSTVLKYHELAVATGEPQEYVYTSPLRGIPFKTIVLPYPDKQVVVLLVMEEQKALVFSAEEARQQA